jgi:hypothetical protein
LNINTYDIDTQAIVIIIFAFILNLVIFYFLIYSAVSDANKDLKRALRILINLKALDLERHGIDAKQALKPLDEIEDLKSQKFHGQISQAQLDERLQDYLI